MKVLAIVPARGGSKRIPRKNLKELLGRPLIAYAILEARKARCVDRVVVSTDDREIAGVARSYGAEVPFLRPPELSTDEASTVSVLAHAMEELRAVEGYEPDFVLVLQPTSPLRTAEEIEAAVDLAVRNGAESLVSVSESLVPPQFLMRVTDDSLVPVVPPVEKNFRKQDLPRTFQLNGSIYLDTPSFLARNRSLRGRETVPLVTSKFTAVDVDDQFDWTVAEGLLRSRNLENKRPVTVGRVDLRDVDLFVGLRPPKSSAGEIRRWVESAAALGVDVLNLGVLTTEECHALENVAIPEHVATVVGVEDSRQAGAAELIEPGAYEIAPSRLTPDLAALLGSAKKPTFLRVKGEPLVEVDLAVNALERSGVNEILLLHECDARPSRVERWNEAFPYLQGASVGWLQGDAGDGSERSLASACCAACWGAKYLELRWPADSRERESARLLKKLVQTTSTVREVAKWRRPALAGRGVEEG
ncbi:MAG: hypothetical protein Kow0069_17700 [Promethearchaeota archaeon]